MPQGQGTTRFGEALVKEFGGALSVHFDHGDRQSVNNVAACKAFYGEDVHNFNRLSDVDVIIGDKNKGDALVIVEIEERPSSPKKIIGAVFAFAMANNIAVGKVTQTYYRIGPKTKLIVAGILPVDGTRIQKVEKIIQERLRSFRREEHEFNLENVTLVFRDSLNDALLETMMEIRKALILPNK